MNQEQFKWFWSQLKGPLKNQWGRFTDDDLLQIGGNVEKFNSTLEARYGGMRG